MMRRLTLVAVIAAFGGSAYADTCYRRAYSGEHLKKNPDQTVSIIEVRFSDRADDRRAFARVIFRDSPKVWTNGLYCWNESPADDPGATMRCGVECDGGTFTVRPKGNDAIYITTRGGFNVGGSCPDGDDFLVRSVTDTGAAKTVFRLNKVNPVSCQ